MSDFRGCLLRGNLESRSFSGRAEVCSPAASRASGGSFKPFKFRKTFLVCNFWCLGCLISLVFICDSSLLSSFSLSSTHMPAEEVMEKSEAASDEGIDGDTEAYKNKLKERRFSRGKLRGVDSLSGCRTSFYCWGPHLQGPAFIFVYILKSSQVSSFFCHVFVIGL